MLVEVCALSWLEVFYGAAVNSLGYGSWDPMIVIAITLDVIQYNNECKATDPAPIHAPAPDPQESTPAADTYLLQRLLQQLYPVFILLKFNSQDCHLF